RFAALALVVAQGGVASLLFLLAPRLQTVAPALPATLGLGLGAAAVVAWLWFGLLLLSFYRGVLLLPERWLERGPYLRLMSLTSRVARPFGRRDWWDHAAIDVYNALCARRQRSVWWGGLLGT